MFKKKVVSVVITAVIFCALPFSSIAADKKKEQHQPGGNQPALL